MQTATPPTLYFPEQHTTDSLKITADSYITGTVFSTTNKLTLLIRQPDVTGTIVGWLEHVGDMHSRKIRLYHTQNTQCHGESRVIRHGPGVGVNFNSRNISPQPCILPPLLSIRGRPNRAR